MTMNAGCDNSAAGRCAMMVAAALAMMAVGRVGLALGQIPCGYEVSAIIQAPPCQFTGPPPTIGTGISTNGRFVCGYWYDCAVSTTFHAFLYDTQTSQFTSLPFPPGVTSVLAYGVNDSAKVVGQMVNSAIDQYQGFIWNSQTGQYTTLIPISLHGWATVNAINNSNTVCGNRSIGSPRDPVHPYEAFAWTGGVFTDLGVMNGPNSNAFAISSIGDVVGFTGVDPFVAPTSAFVRSNGSITVLPPVPGGTTSIARGVSDLGDVAVNGKTQIGTITVTRAFRYTGGQMVPLPLLPGTNSNGAFGMTADGVLIGSCANNATPNNRRWCVWKNQAVYDVGAIVQLPLGVTFDGLSAISASGKLIGGCQFNAASATAVLVPIERLIGDENCDGMVNIDDLVKTITSWGTCTGCAADFNLDGTVNIDDLVTVITHWSP
jgi:uncharacterized membrane protein